LYKLRTQGHIEDIAIKKDQQGKKLGLKLIEALDYVAEQVGCYKVCLLLGTLDGSVLIERFRIFLIRRKEKKASIKSVDMQRQVQKCSISLTRKPKSEEFEG
jgi:N-acetylglutamate synthase-like GNAT family acetyltransferase